MSHGATFEAPQGFWKWQNCQHVGFSGAKNSRNLAGGERPGDKAQLAHTSLWASKKGSQRGLSLSPLLLYLSIYLYQHTATCCTSCGFYYMHTEQYFCIHAFFSCSLGHLCMSRQWERCHIFPSMMLQKYTKFQVLKIASKQNGTEANYLIRIGNLSICTSPVIDITIGDVSRSIPTVPSKICTNYPAIPHGWCARDADNNRNK